MRYASETRPTAPARAAGVRAWLACALLALGTAAVAGPVREEPVQVHMERQRLDGRDLQRQDMARAALEEQRRAALDEQRRAAIQAQQEQAARYDNFRRTGRMSADERRDLRRQINEAGQDLYGAPVHR